MCFFSIFFGIETVKSLMFNGGFQEQPRCFFVNNQFRMLQDKQEVDSGALIEVFKP